MYDISTLKPGDVVRIVDEWTEGYGRQNHNGFMNKYLGSEMTVRTIEERNGEYSAKMIEDKDDMYTNGWWTWFNEMIAGLSTDEDFDACDEEEFASIMS